MTDYLYRARTNIGAPGKFRALTGGRIALNKKAAEELIAIGAIDPEPLAAAPVDPVAAAVAADVALTATQQAGQDEPIKTAETPAASVPAIPNVAALNAMNVADLKVLAKQLGITGQDSSTKAAIIAAIAAKAAGPTAEAS